MKLISMFLSIACIAALFVFSGCKKDDNPAGPGGTTGTSYVGTIAGASETGALSFTVAAGTASPKRTPSAGILAILNVTGTLKISGGSTIAITGTFNTETDSLFLTAGAYTFVGTLSGGKINGSYNGPNGAGTFAVQSPASGSTVKVYLGSYQQTSPPSENTGVINVIVEGTSITVLVSGGSVYYGTLNGSEITIYASGTSGTAIATGTLSGTTMSGTYQGDGDSGTWEATLSE